MDTLSVCEEGSGTKDLERSSSCSQTGHGKERPCPVTSRQPSVGQCLTGSTPLMVSRPSCPRPSLAFLSEEKLELEIHSRHFCYIFLFSLYQFILVLCFSLWFHYFLCCFPIICALGGVWGVGYVYRENDHLVFKGRRHLPVGKGPPCSATQDRGVDFFEPENLFTWILSPVVMWWSLFLCKSHPTIGKTLPFKDLLYISVSATPCLKSPTN